LVLGPNLYGLTPNPGVTLSQFSKHNYESPPTDTLTKLGLIVQLNGQTIVVADGDLPTRMGWKEAHSLCNHLGNGWRLPSKDELDAMYTQLHLKGQGIFCVLGY